MKRGAVVIMSLLVGGSLPAFAQSNPGSSELLGAPGYQAEQERAAKRAAARRQVEDEIAKVRKPKADAAAAARQAAARKADAARRSEAKAGAPQRRGATRDFAARESELAARESALEARERELADEQERLANQLAGIADPEDAETSAEAPGALPGETLPERHGPERYEQERFALDDLPAMRLDASIRSCAYAGEDKALARDYVSARYVNPPRFYERSRYDDGVWQLRGVMRVEDWRGSLLADTVCELDRDGRVQYFAFLRP